jgi:hypothetical protein
MHDRRDIQPQGASPARFETELRFQEIVPCSLRGRGDRPGEDVDVTCLPHPLACVMLPSCPCIGSRDTARSGVNAFAHACTCSVVHDARAQPVVSFRLPELACQIGFASREGRVVTQIETSFFTAPERDDHNDSYAENRGWTRLLFSIAREPVT